MRLRIIHETEYSYDAPLHYALQRLRVTPIDGQGQKVIDWRVTLDGADTQVGYQDMFGNTTELISCQGERHMIRVTVAGEVETRDTAGVVGPHTGFVPLWLYQRPTALTQPGKGVGQLAKGIEDGDRIARLHALMAKLREAMRYEIGTTTAATTAEEALSHGEGVCQDFAHVFIAAARLLDCPARYVSGYLLMEDRIDQAASHAWAEAFVDGLGWVGFDVANGISPDARYVRVAVGRDYQDAAPVSGIRHGEAEESLAVSIRVEQ